MIQPTFPMQSVPSGTVTFLFSDIEGSTTIAQQHPALWEEMRSRHNALLQLAMHTHNGHVFQIIGDAFCVAFHTAGEALQAAIQAQLLLQAEPWQATPIKVRIGIHTGAAFLVNEKDISGGYQGYMTMARVQRVMSLAYGGQILISNTSASLARSQLAMDYTLLDLQEHRLKGFPEPERLWQVVAPGLPEAFPQLQSQESNPNNLPAQITRFVGREAELETLKSQLVANRLITLTGPGGIGKTRLSIEVAIQSLEDFWYGAWLVELAVVSDPLLLARTVAAVLGVKVDMERPALDALTSYLHEKKLLLVLDNCEHLVGPCAQLAEHLLRHCPGLKVLATSRENLGLPGEIILPVAPMSLPPADQSDLQSMQESDAVRFFTHCSAAALPGFELTTGNSLAIFRICRRLDGIPLALELAAARVRMLSVEQIAARLEDSFRLLVGGSRTALPRQQTLRATLDWSYNLLTPAECAVFRRLAVFAGGWTLEAAEAVCADQDVPTWEVLDLLGQLVNKSLVFVNHPAAGESRYFMLETTRQYAREKLQECGELQTIHRAHLDYCLHLGSQAKSITESASRLPYQKKMIVEWDNFRDALRWSLGKGSIIEAEKGLRLAVYYSFLPESTLPEHHEWLQKALALTKDSTRQLSLLRAQAMIIAGGIHNNNESYKGMEDGLAKVRQNPLATPGDLAWSLVLTGIAAYIVRGDLGRAEACLAEAVSLYRASPASETWQLANALYFQTWVYFWAGNYAQATLTGQETSSLFLKLGDLAYAAWSERLLSIIAKPLGNYADAIHHLENAILLLKQIDPAYLDFIQDAYHSCNLILAGLELDQGSHSEAANHLEEALAYFRQIGDELGIDQALKGLGQIAMAQRNYQQAAVYFQERLCLALDWQDDRTLSIGLADMAYLFAAAGLLTPAACLAGVVDPYTSMWSHTARQNYHNFYQATRQALGQAVFDREYETGKAFTLAEAVVYALDQPVNFLPPQMGT